MGEQKYYGLSEVYEILSGYLMLRKSIRELKIKFNLL